MFKIPLSYMTLPLPPIFSAETVATPK